MGGFGSKPKEGDKKKGAEDDESKGGKCTLSNNTMKLVTLVTLLVSDFDFLLSWTSIFSYFQAGGVFYGFIGLIVIFFMIYTGGCVIAARESLKFMDRFKDKVRLNEINGISMEDLEDALGNRRIFWMGTEFEAAKKRKTSVEALKAATPDATGPEEIDIQYLTSALREAEMVGTAMLKMPGDPKFGAKAVKRATDKLIQAKKVQGVAAAGLGRRASSRIQRDLGGPEVELDDVHDPSYKPNKAKTRDEMEGRSDKSAGPVDLDEIGGDDEDDYAAKMFEEEIKVAEDAGDVNLVKMLQLASLKQLDSYKVDKKLCDNKGRITDPLRALYMICEAKGILHSYHQASRTFSRRIVKPSHSIPFYRLMQYGWQPTVSHTDFAGILNANALYSFTVGTPQLVFALAFIQYSSTVTNPKQPCEQQIYRTRDGLRCNLIQDINKPNVQNNIVAGSLTLGLISLVLSLVNILVDFPAQLFDIAEKEEESMHFTLQAEQATKTWEDKLAVEVQENIKMMLKMSTQFENNSIPGMEAPGLVIEDVMKLERRAMEKKVAYIEHFLTMSEDEKKVRSDLREGKRKKKKADDPDYDFEDEEEIAEEPAALPAPIIRQPTAPMLPPPRQPTAPVIQPPREPSFQSIPEPTAPPARVPTAPSASAFTAAASASSLGGEPLPVEEGAPAPL